jgi:2-methylisocitrate lyase-like PEP mutase family enzyme
MSVPSKSPGARFRALLAHGPIACVGAFDALSAKVITSIGARAVYVSGFAAAASAFGEADLGVVTQSEMAEHIRRICRATPLPVIAYADTGYGGVLNVERTVRDWESAGAAGLHLEDQVFPKRCGHLAGKEVIPLDEYLSKLRAALAARSDPNFFIIARTDALAVHGMDDTLRRCEAFAAAGADAVFVDSPRSVDDLKAIASAMRDSGVPLVFNSARTGRSPVLVEGRLADLGYPIVLYPLEAMLIAQHAVREHVRALMHARTTELVSDRMLMFDEVNSLVGLQEALKRSSGTGS